MAIATLAIATVSLSGTISLCKVWKDEKNIQLLEVIFPAGLLINKVDTLLDEGV